MRYPLANASSSILYRDGTVLYGTADPLATDGLDGEFFLNTTTYTLFGPKADGAWPAGVSLTGQATEAAASAAAAAASATAANAYSSTAVKTPAGGAGYDLINELSATGVLPKLSALWVPATVDSTLALVNLLNPANFNMVNHLATFTPKAGFMGDGVAAYLDTKYDPNADAAYLPNAAHVGFLIGGANAQESKWVAGAMQSRLLFRPRDTSDTLIARFNSVTSVAVAGVTDSRGHFVLNRDGASSWQIYRNGGQLYAGTEASAAKLTGDLIALASDTIGTSNSTRTIQAIHVGGVLTATDVENIRSALMDYMAAIGAMPKIDAFLVMGQSNGIHGSAGPPAAPNVVNALNFGGSTGSNLAWGALGTSGYTAISTAWTGTLWPAFANAYFKATGRVPAFYNVCRGSTALLAAADTGAGNWSPTGTLRGLAVTGFNSGLVGLKGLGKIVSRNVIWIQGEQDAVQYNGSTVTGPLYQSALEDLNTYLGANITGGISEMLVIQTGVQRDGLYVPGFSAIRQAQSDACFETSNLRLINTDAQNYASMMDDTLHWNQKLLNHIGERAGITAAQGLELAA